MNQATLKHYYESRQIPSTDYEHDLILLESVELIMQTDFEALSIEDLDAAIDYLYFSNKINVAAFIAMMRASKAYGRHDLYIRCTQYTNSMDVIESIVARMEKQIGKAETNTVLSTISFPHLGMPPEEIIFFTEAFMEVLKANFSEEQIQSFLIGNNHQIPKNAFAQEIVEYENAPTLEAYLKGKHERMIAVLQEHSDQKKVWFEQIITQEVVDYIATNQEFLSAVLDDEKLYLTKIPYDVKNYLVEEDPKQKRYLSCHCPFARDAILNDSIDISPLWCYCSAGFEKYPFEVVLDQPLKIKVLESVLAGNDRCRFVIDLKNILYKK